MSARMAAATITKTRKPPAAPSGLCVMNRRRADQARAGAGGGPGRTRTASAAELCAITDPWVEPGVEQVYQQVGQDDRGADDHDLRLHDDVVSPGDGLDQQAADPRQVEDLFGDDEPANEE